MSTVALRLYRVFVLTFVLCSFSSSFFFIPCLPFSFFFFVMSVPFLLINLFLLLLTPSFFFFPLNAPLGVLHDVELLPEWVVRLINNNNNNGDGDGNDGGDGHVSLTCSTSPQHTTCVPFLDSFVSLLKDLKKKKKEGENKEKKKWRARVCLCVCVSACV